MNTGRRRTRFAVITVLILIPLMICFIWLSVRELHSPALLTVIPGNSSLYIRQYDLTVKGQDKDGVTYFFLPSYADTEVISQKASAGRIYTAGGELLSDPAFGVVQDVTIDPGDGQAVPWKVSFVRSANLYTLEIDLEETDVYDIDHDTYISSSISLYTPLGKKEYTTDKALLKGRGNTTWAAKKQPYEIRLPDSFPLCGMDSSPKWVLLANFFDDTKILNKMAMDLSDSLGMDYAIQSDWVDLYINGEYWGNYLLCKEPGIGKGRIKINDGFLVEKDIRTSVEEDPCTFLSGDDMFRIKDPLPLKDDMKEDIISYVNMIDTQIRDLESSGEFPRINTDSFTRRFLIDELFNNPDAMQTSCYFYKHEGVLYAGPCWDYDLSCGKSLNGMGYYDYTRSILDDLSEDALDWDYKLMQNSEYRSDFDALFSEEYPVLFDMIQTRIDIYADKISSSLAMDRALWQNDEEPVRFYSDADNKYRFLKFYLNERMKLLADECGFDAGLTDMSLTNDSIHTVTFITDSGKYILTVADGTQLSEKDLPPLDKTGFSGWMYTREQKPFSPFLPIYEDISLEPAPLK